MNLFALPPHTIIVHTVGSSAMMSGLACSLIRRGRRTLICLAPGLTRAQVQQELHPLLHKTEIDLIRRCMGEPVDGPTPPETLTVTTIPNTCTIYRAGEVINLTTRIAQGVVATSRLG